MTPFVKLLSWTEFQREWACKTRILNTCSNIHISRVSFFYQSRQLRLQSDGLYLDNREILVRLPVGVRDFLLSQMSRQRLWPTRNPVQQVQWPFPLRASSQEVNLTTHLRLVADLRISAAINVHPPSPHTSSQIAQVQLYLLNLSNFYQTIFPMQKRDRPKNLYVCTCVCVCISQLRKLSCITDRLYFQGIL